MEATRRDVVLGSLVVAGLSLIGCRPDSSTPLTYLYDPSLDTTGRRGAVAVRAGFRILAIDADIGRLAHALDAHWRERLSAIAGLTGPAGFFIMQQIAIRRGLELFERDGAQWAFAPSASPNDRRSLSTLFAS